jgi:hypothetical protein
VLAGVRATGLRETYVIGVVLFQYPATAFVDFLVAHALAAHGERRVHVHIMTGQIQTDQSLENYTKSRECGCQKNQETGGSAPIRDHVQDCAKLGRLVEVACRKAVERVEQA